MKKLLEWTPEYVLGNNNIDKDHEKLFLLLNKLYDAVCEAKSESILETIIDELFQYTIYHFDKEEKLFQKFNYKYAEAHIKQHELFLDKIKDFNVKSVIEAQRTAIQLLNFIRDWIINHILFLDKKYIEKFNMLNQ